MKKHLIIAPVGGKTEAIFSAVREFATQQVILIAEPDHLKTAEKVKKDLERFQIPATILQIKGNIWEEIFRIVHETVEHMAPDIEVLISVTSGKEFMRCAVTSAAFVNGLKAFGVTEEGEIVLFPVLKFSYYNLLSDRKMKLLSLLSTGSVQSMDELSHRAKMSLSLVSYHINGNLKSDGLKQLGLVDATEKNGRVQIELTTMGRLLLKGYITEKSS